MSSTKDLGTLVWFSVHNTSVPVRLALVRARELFDELGLDPAFLPQGILPIHAFQAASAATTSEYIDPETTEHVELRIQEVKRSKEWHERHVVRHATNPRTRLTSTAMLIQLKFIHAERTVKGRRSDGHDVKHRVAKTLREGTMGERARLFDVTTKDLEMAEDWLGRFYAEYEQLQTHLSADAIRTVIRDYLISSDAILANSRGGVYFVPAEHEKTITALRSFVNKISDECSLHTVSLVDTAENRATLRDIWRGATAESLERINGEIDNLRTRATMRAGQVSRRAYINLKVEWDALANRIQDYGALTNTPPGVVKELVQPTASAIYSLQQLVR